MARASAKRLDEVAIQNGEMTLTPRRDATHATRPVTAHRLLPLIATELYHRTRLSHLLQGGARGTWEDVNPVGTDILSILSGMCPRYRPHDGLT